MNSYRVCLFVILSYFLWSYIGSVLSNRRCVLSGLRSSVTTTPGRGTTDYAVRIVCASLSFRFKALSISSAKLMSSNRLLD